MSPLVPEGAAGEAVPADASALLAGWVDFADPLLVIDKLVVMVLAALLGAVLAYHPVVRAKAATVEELEQPKAFIMYALVGAVTALIVQVNDLMALVVFGIGGLMRFRTNVGPAKDTGRVILAAVVGMCCGLKLYVVAVLATAFGWLLTYQLERREIGRLLVKGLPDQAVTRAADAYRQALRDAGCRVLSERKKVEKGTVTIVFTAPQRLDREALERRFAESIPAEHRGALDWEIV